MCRRWPPWQACWAVRPFWPATSPRAGRRRSIRWKRCAPNRFLGDRAVEQGFSLCYGKVIVPREIAETYHIHPGDDIDWVPAGEVIRVVPPGKQAAAQDRESQLRMFDQATERYRKRPSAGARAPVPPRDRGW